MPPKRGPQPIDIPPDLLAALPPDFDSLPLRQQRYILNYLQTGNRSQAAKDAGYSDSYATSQIYRDVRKNQIERNFRALLPLYGVTNGRVLKAISEGLDATKQMGKYDFKTHAWSYSKRQSDHETRLKAADMALKLAAAYPKEEVQEGRFSLVMMMGDGPMQVNAGQPPNPATSAASEPIDAGQALIEVGKMMLPKMSATDSQDRAR
jgi:Terminase small subunit